MIWKIRYQPTEKQRLFHESKANEVLFGGAAGGGKSRAIVMDAVMRCLRWKGTHAYVFRRTYGELEDTVIREAMGILPQGLIKYHGGRHEITFPNGSMIHFRHCQHAADRFLYKGAEIQWLYMDELTSFEQEIYDFLKTRLRAKKSLGITPCVRCASNPGDIGHGWVKKYFVDPAPPGETFSRQIKSEATGRSRTYTLQYIPALVTENPYIGEDYIFQLEQKPKALREALLFGSWNAFEGQVFTEWRDDPSHALDRKFTHVIEPFAIPPSWKRYMSFDHGYSKPFSVGWWAVAPDGCAYRYREWYGCVQGSANTGLKLTPQEIAQGILDREQEEKREGIPIYRIADPAVFDASRGDSVARQMEPAFGRPGLYMHPGDHTRLAGKMQVHERLRFREDGRPKLQVFSTCRDFLRTVPALPYSVTQCEDIDTDAEDHIYDEMRYFCMANPLPPRKAPERIVQSFNPFAKRE